MDDMNSVVEQRIKISQLGAQDRKTMTSAKAFDLALDTKHKRASIAADLQSLVAREHIKHGNLDRALEVIRELEGKPCDQEEQNTESKITNVSQLKFR